jgi:hypothetical protein
VPTLLLRMTHQGHSATTFTCGFTQQRGNDSGNLPRSCRQSGIDHHRCHIRISGQKVYNSQHHSPKHGLVPTRTVSRFGCARCGHRQES